MKRKITIPFVLILITFLSACSQVSHRSRSNHGGSHNSSHHSSSYQQYTQRSQIPQSFPPTSNNPGRNLMVRIAQSTIGTPYKWGGNNPQEGFDCSGLMTYIHANALGKRIPRTAAQQRDSSRTISYAQLQPGDMLFFKTSAKSNHVGMYMGNRQFIHAPSSGKSVEISSMDSSYWYKRFVKFGTFL